MKILVLGYIVRGPLGGLAWHHLQYVSGLKQLGHEVLFLEDSDDYPACYDPLKHIVSEDPGYGLIFIKSLFNSMDLKGQWAYYDAHSKKWFGNDKNSVLAFCSSADMVLNISGVNPLRSWWMQIPVRILIDTDPAFTQVKIVTDNGMKEFARSHTHFFSFAENIGKDGCTIPDDGIRWIPTRQPVYLPAWKIADPTPSLKWSTVMQWDSYQSQEYNGIVYGMKSISFEDYLELPSYFPGETFEIALGGIKTPLAELKEKGWQIISSLIPTKTVTTYQDYISCSKGEWSVAKHGYVISNSGWFSERSACYLASGKPVLVQDTGFSEILPTGKGLLAFTSLEHAVEGIHRINSDYEFHCSQARVLAEEFFDSSRVLSRLLSNIS